MEVVAAFFEAAVRTATPLALAACGELVVERAGIINIGLEGAMIAGAFGALIGAGTGSTAVGFITSAVCGAAVAMIFGILVVRLRSDQIITGATITLLAMGLTGTLYQALYGEAGAALSIPTNRPTEIPGLSRLPVIGPALFAQPVISYIAYLLFPMLWWWLYRTRSGLALRAVGERPEAADAAGVRTNRVRFLAILFGGAAGGLSGGSLVLAQAGTFAEGMTAGRGFIAIAVVALGRWHPVGVAIAALLFGTASATQFLFQAMEWELPYHLFLAFPYLLTLTALARMSTRITAPAALGR